MEALLAHTVAHVNAGGLPFGAMVLDPAHAPVSVGFNRVAEDRDPTAHAEVIAIREACRQRARSDLDGHMLVATGEPCGLCLLAAEMVGIEIVWFGVDRHEAAGFGFDYRRLYRRLSGVPGIWNVQARHLPFPGIRQPFKAHRDRNQ